MLYVKIMSGEDMPDTIPHKNFTIVPIADNEVMEFTEIRYVDRPPPCPGEPSYKLVVHAPEGGTEEHALTGNAYVMNEAGKTIATHGA